VIVSEGETHMVLDQFPQASSTAMKRNVHDGGHKFIDGRHGTSLGWRLIPPSPANSPGNCSRPFFSCLLSGLSVTDNVLNVKVKGNSKRVNFIDEQ
jgi:hypothetical protein